MWEVRKHTSYDGIWNQPVEQFAWTGNYVNSIAGAMASARGAWWTYTICRKLLLPSNLILLMSCARWNDARCFRMNYIVSAIVNLENENVTSKLRRMSSSVVMRWLKISSVSFLSGISEFISMRASFLVHRILRDLIA